MRPPSRTLLIAALLASLTPSTGCRRIEEARTQPPTVRVVAATQGLVGEYATFTGVLKARHRAAVSSAQPGTVIRVAATDGDAVAEGQPLIWLDTRDAEARLHEQQTQLASARADMTQTEATLRQSESKLKNDVEQAQQALAQTDIAVRSATTQMNANQRDMTRLQTLYKEKAVSRSQMEKAELQYKLSVDELHTARSKQPAALASLRLAQKGERDVEMQRAQLAVSRSKVAQAEAAVNTVQVSLQQSVLRSPMAGTVVERSVEPGQVVGGGGTPLMTVVDNRKLECVASLEEQYANRVTRGQPAILNTSLEPDANVHATVTDVVPSSDPKTNTVKMRLRLDQVTADVPASKMLATLTDGVTVTGRLTLAKHRGVVIPREALHHNGTQAFVSVVEAQAAHTRQVTVEHENQTHAVVKEIRAGEFVICEGELPKDGQQVTVDYAPVSTEASATPSHR